MYIINEHTSEENTLMYIMEEHGISFCMLSFYEKEKHLMCLSNLNVAENYREEGRGNDILGFAIKRAKSRGCEYLYLYTTDKNSWITEWYKRIGFVEYKCEDEECYMYLKLK